MSEGCKQMEEAESAVLHFLLNRKTQRTLAQGVTGYWLSGLEKRSVLHAVSSKVKSADC